MVLLRRANNWGRRLIDIKDTGFIRVFLCVKNTGFSSGGWFETGLKLVVRHVRADILNMLGFIGEKCLCICMATSNFLK